MILLDTHIWVWWIQTPERLASSTLAYLDALQPSEVCISAISCWEVAKLVQKGRLDLFEPVDKWLQQATTESGVSCIQLEIPIIVDACNLPGTFHPDPADQLIVATSRVKNIPLLTADQKILGYEFVQVYNE